MGILDNIRSRYNLSNIGAVPPTTDGFTPQDRMTAVTLSNTIELATETVHALMRGKNGLTDDVGGQRMLKRDIATAIANRILVRVQDTINSNGVSK
ncbi:MAG: hypothetical protein ACRDBQ_18285 [Shewanella sp.]